MNRDRTTRVLQTTDLARPQPQPFAALARLALLLGLLAVVLGELGALSSVDRLMNLGVVWGDEQAPLAGGDRNPMGINVFLESEGDQANVKRTLRMARDGGYTMIRQGFLWNDIEIAGKGDFTDRRHSPARSSWDKYDYIVEQARANNLDILARLDAPPTWALLCPDMSHGAPAKNSDYADFVSAVVSRYRGKVRYFQIWNEPNLEGEWSGRQGGACVRHPNPAEYTALLKAAYLAAHAANPDAVVLSAPLAQTIETGPANLSDLLYLQGMYDAGARPYFDIASVMAYGLAYPPTDRRAEPKRINFSRPVLTRGIMVDNGDAGKAMWASEYGWISLPPGWTGKPGIWGNHTEAEQAAFLLEGYQRARAEWPWMGMMFVWHLRDPTPSAGEPQPYFGILNADWSPRPAYTTLQRYSRRFPTADTGAVTPDDKALAVSGPWDKGTLDGRAVYTATARSSAATLTFQGNAVDLVIAQGSTPGSLTASLDGAPPGTPVALPASGMGQGPAATGWQAPAGRTAVRVQVAQGLPETRHTLTISPGESSGPVTLLGFIVAREPGRAWAYALGYTLITALALWLGVRFTFAAVALGGLVRRAAVVPGLEGERARAGVAVVALAAALAAYYVLPSQKWALVAFGVWFLLACWRPDMALVVTAGAIPFTWAPRPLGEWTFALSESCIWAILAAWAVHQAILVPWFASRQGKAASAPALWPASLAGNGGSASPLGWLRASLRRDLFAAPAVALLVVGTFSLLTVAAPDYVKDSLRQYRWTIVEPVLFYFLLTDIRPGRRQAYRLADGFIAGGVLAALIAVVGGVLRLPNFTNDTQGVTAYQGLFPHHDNLGLYLGRTVAFSGALAIFLRPPDERIRRALYGAATLLMLPALALSYSRGAWIAVVAALGVSLLLLGGRQALIFAGGLAVAAVGLGLAALAHLLPERITHIGSGLIRLDLWKSALDMLRDHPVFGIGLDQFLNQYQGPYTDILHAQERWLSHPHNILLDWWLSLGIIGVLVAIWMGYRAVRAGLDLARHGDAHTSALARSLLAALTAVLVHGLIDNSYFLQDLALTVWFLCALLAGVRGRESGTSFEF
ncbi:MAG: O-antigen ligase family protein [Chloroflexia bacterium]